MHAVTTQRQVHGVFGIVSRIKLLKMSNISAQLVPFEKEKTLFHQTARECIFLKVLFLKVDPVNGYP